ncbi:hypothetical protein BUE76_20475 [Cnuella takakiae]|nr:hypothetical protein BUE76_20475 [Cnuella takakiae]
MKHWLPLGSGIWTLLLTGNLLHAQTTSDSLPPFIQASAAAHYLPLLSQKKAVGERYRLDWALPVQAPVARLDTLKGGLKLYAASNNGQQPTLIFTNTTGQAIALRPVQYAPARALPDIYQGTMVSDFAADLGSAYQPYAPLTVGPMTRAAALPLSPVQLVYLPRQQALGNFPAQLLNRLYFLQAMPVNAGADTTTTWVRTQRMLQLAETDNRNQPDAATYLKYRLLDMLLGISTRDEESWRWQAQPSGETTRYLPVPNGYEGAYARFDGRLLTIAKIVAPIGHLVSFDRQMPEPGKLNGRSLHLDRRLTASLSAADWQAIARQLKTALTDAVLQEAISQLPPEIQTASGASILANLKSRRNVLDSYAKRYYDLLATHADVIASRASEQVRITGSTGKGVQVSIYDLDETGKAAATPFFNRAFNPDETREVNLYGVGGNDQFLAEGDIEKKIKLRIIGGPQKDSLRNRSRNGNIDLYDSRANTYTYGGHVRYHLSDEADVHQYDFDAFAFNKQGLRPMVFYSNNDRIYAGLAYKNTKQGWRKVPFAQQHKAYLNYSLWQGGVSAGYEGIFTQIIGKWNGLLSAEYDAIRWNNFFGIGNETPPQVADNNFHRVRSEVVNADAGLFRPLGRHHSIGLSARFQTVRIRPDTERFVGKEMSDDPLLFRTHQFGGGRLTYGFVYLNNPLVPTKGLQFNASAGYMRNLKQTNREIRTYNSNVQVYLPLAKRWVFKTGGGIQSVNGQPEFYQLSTIGGSATLRGFRRERFWGNTAAYTQNEVMYVAPFRSYWFNGPVGIFGLFDAGRIWQPGETSNRVHTGYGLGLMLVPFNKIRVELAYARSAERGMLHIGYRGSL